MTIVTGPATEATRNERHQQIERTPEHRDEGEGLPAAQPITQETPGPLEDRVAPRERGQHPAELHLRQPQLSHHPVAGDGHVGPEHIRDEADEHEEREDFQRTRARPIHRWALSAGGCHGSRTCGTASMSSVSALPSASSLAF